MTVLLEKSRFVKVSENYMEIFINKSEQHILLHVVNNGISGARTSVFELIFAVFKVL